MSVVSPRSAAYRSLQDIIRRMPNCIAIVDRSRCIVACNWYGLDTFPRHLKHARLFCHEIFDIEPGQTCQPCIVDQVFASEKPCSFEKTLPHNGVVHVEAFPVFDETGQVAFAVQQFNFSTFQAYPEDELANTTRVMETSDTPFSVIDVDGKVMYVNEAFLDMWGYQRKGEIIGKNVSSLWDREAEAGVALKTLQQQEYLSTQMLGQDRHGDQVRAQVSGSLIRNSDGNSACIWLSFLDITQYINVEQQLHDSEARFRDMADSLPQTIFEADTTGRITFANVYAFQLFGYNQADIDAGMNIVQVIAPKDRVRAMGLAQRVLRGEMVVQAEVEACRRNGSTFPVVVCSNPIVRDQGVVGFRGTLMDVSEQKRIEKSLRTSQERYRALVENQVELVIRWLPDTTLTYVNQAYCRFFEKSEDQLIGRKFLDQVPEIYHKYLDRQIASVLEDPKTVYSEFQSIAADGRPAWHRWSDTPIVGQDGKVVEFQSVGMDITELKEAYQRLHRSELRYQHLAQHDPLTGLPNRVLLFDRLNHVVSKCRRFGRAFALLVVDLDRFKRVTDALGHDGADRVLCQVGKRFGELVRESDTLAKMSGDEFVIVCDEINSAEGPSVLAQMLLDSLSVPFEVDGHILSLSATVGISFWKDGISSLESLMHEADLAMHEGKRQGGNRYLFFNRQMSERTRGEVCVEGLLRRAIQNDALHLVYLPQINLASGLTAGIETLVRLNDPDGNCILPGVFVPIAEKTGLILELGDWVLEKACAQNCRWQEAGFVPTVITVNISPEQFSQSDFADKVMHILAKTGMKPCWLELEINERAIIENVVHAIEMMETLTRVGVCFAIDDFGKGFSCLAHLRHLPVSKLKIDRTFTRQVPENDLDVKLVNTVVALARSLGVQTVVEGVETDKQREYFRELQCDLAQGYLFGPPKSAEEIRDFLT